MGKEAKARTPKDGGVKLRQAAANFSFDERDKKKLVSLGWPTGDSEDYMIDVVLTVHVRRYANMHPDVRPTQQGKASRLKELNEVLKATRAVNKWVCDDENKIFVQLQTMDDPRLQIEVPFIIPTLEAIEETVSRQVKEISKAPSVIRTWSERQLTYWVGGEIRKLGINPNTRKNGMLYQTLAVIYRNLGIDRDPENDVRAYIQKIAKG